MELEECDRILAERWTSEEKAHHQLALLFQSAREGHLCLPSQENLPSELVDFVATRESVLERPFVSFNGNLYLQRNWKAECALVEEWNRLSKGFVKPIQEEGSWKEGLLPEQVEAIAHVLRHSVTLLVGGPGTGKTFTARRLIDHLQKEAPDLQLVLAAPTGKAASNLRAGSMGELQPKTLHSLLYRSKFVEGDLILVDESSMMDAEMMVRLLSAVRSGCRLVLVGDPDQLPPVESGSLFSELVARGENVCSLERCLRAEEEGLIQAAHAIRVGREPTANAAVTRGTLPSPQELAEKVVSRWRKALVGREPLEALRCGALLSFVRKGPYGVNQLNLLCREKAVDLPQPIMITSNDHQRELYNGELGVMIGGEALFTAADGSVRRVPSVLLPPYEEAFVLSVHKSQGSEFDDVTLLLCEGAERFGREGLYTAATRAKKALTILGDEKQMQEMLAKRMQRRSGLSFG